MTLLDCQRALQADVLQSTLGSSTRILETITASASQRMAVYVQGYCARLIEVLRQDFPGLRVLLGEDGFDEASRAYVEATPSHRYNIRWYGAELAEFIRTASPWCENPALEEMVRFEWCLGLAFDAADEAVVGAATFQGVPAEEWPTMRFGLSKSLERCVLHWNVAAVRKALDASETPPALERMAEPQTRAIYRKGITVFHRAIESDEAAALDVIDADGNFAEVCEVLCRWYAVEEVAVRSLSLLKRWIDEGWIANLVLSRPEPAASSKSPPHRRV